MTDHSPATSLCVSHVELYVADAEAAASAFVDGYGFQVCATAERGAGLEGSSRSLPLRQANIVLVPSPRRSTTPTLPRLRGAAG
ncbi:hypothetical protein [Streptomyces sp. WG5]|uniref:hypothetical protein n=1 Tax=Streptomyces sp. WG5 TaxID=3417648 RepID=UPI003CF70540